jgi:hypothetical protein
MSSDPISTAYLVNASHQSVCLYVNIARQRLGKDVTAATNTHNSRISGRIILSAVRVVSKESLWVRLCIPLLLLVNGSVNTFPRHRGNVGGVVYYAVHVVSKKEGDYFFPELLVKETLRHERIWEMKPHVQVGLISLRLYKGNNKLRDWKNVFTLHIPP